VHLGVVQGVVPARYIHSAEGHPTGAHGAHIHGLDAVDNEAGLHSGPDFQKAESPGQCRKRGSCPKLRRNGGRK